MTDPILIVLVTLFIVALSFSVCVSWIAFRRSTVALEWLDEIEHDDRHVEIDGLRTLGAVRQEQIDLNLISREIGDYREPHEVVAQWTRPDEDPAPRVVENARGFIPW